MTRPGLFTYLFGNPVTSLGSLGLLALAGYKMYLGQYNFIPVLVAGLIAARCWQCASQIQAYNRWQRDWNAMNGGTASGGLFARTPWLRWPAVVVLWGGVSWLAVSNLTGTVHALAVAWFWGGSALLAAYGLFRLWRKRPRRAKAANWDDVAARVKVPTVSADAGRAASALPDYCRQLLS